MASAGANGERIAGLLIDIDGTLHEAGAPIEGAADALARLRDRVPFLFTTNTSRMPRREVAARLASFGIVASDGEILTASVAAAHWLRSESIASVQLLAPPAVREDFAGFEIVDVEPEAVVVADMGAGFTFEILNSAFSNLLFGARLVAIHRNRYWLTEAGPTLDAGPFVAALEYAAKVPARLVGKPAPAFFETAADMLGLPAPSLAVVGDDPETDVAGARRAGLFSVQVRTGKYRSAASAAARETREEGRDEGPDIVIDSVRDLPGLLLGADA